MIGNYKSDSHATVDSLHDIKQQLLQQRANYMLEPKSPGVKTLLLNGSKQLLDKVLSPAKESKEKGSPVQEKPLLMTRRQYADPMGLWDEEEEKGQAEEPAQPVLDVETANVSTFIYKLEFWLIIPFYTLRNWSIGTKKWRRKQK